MDYTQFNVVKPVEFKGSEESINYWLDAGWKMLSIVSFHKEHEHQATTAVVFGRIDKHKFHKQD